MTGQQISISQIPISGFFPTFSTPPSRRPFDSGGAGAGSIIRNGFFEQGLFNLDPGIRKAFRIVEGQSLTFRAEAFGRITGTYSPFHFVGAFRTGDNARMVMFSLRYVF